MGALSGAVRPHTRGAVLVACCAVVLLAACGSGGDSTREPIAISDAWALATGVGQPNGAVFFTITSAADDKLERVSVPDTIADHTEVHEAVTTANGAIGMQEMTSGVPLGAGTAVTFTPGGMHVMLVELVHPLVVDDTFEVTLEFARADPITLPVVVVESAP
ncbi:MAG TPA: copper chaperone PCu(A)C [Ilumatobacter sp.]